MCCLCSLWESVLLEVFETDNLAVITRLGLILGRNFRNALVAYFCVSVIFY